MDATIDNVTFDEIRDYPVFSFTTTVPVRDELPEVARYLRARADASGAIKAPLPEEQDPLTGYETDGDIAN
jgi:shikimate 5-dehydrogenase